MNIPRLAAAFIWAFFLMVFSHGSALGEEKVVKVATLEDYPPFCLKTGDFVKTSIPPGDDTENFEGYSWDVLRESYHAAGYTIELSVTPWARAMAYLKMGEYDILFPTGKNRDRQKIFHYSKEPVNQAAFVVYLRADDHVEWKGLESLSGLAVGVKRGFNYGDEWKRADFINKYNVDTIRQGFRMLSEKRLDGFAGYEFNWDFVLRRLGWEGRYVKLPRFGSTDEYLAALKSSPDGLEYLEAFDRGKQELLQNGGFEKIRRKWLKD
ncbi:MAG: transporter substrate-binding domain-containing protein [Desulfobacteraceae bacterium]